MKIITPFHMILSSSTMCGKTFWTLKLIRQIDNLFDKAPEQIFYFYNQYNDAFGAGDLNHVHFIRDLPDSVDDIPKDSLIVLDDFMQSIALHF